MIRHTVLFKLKSGVSQEAIDDAFHLLFALQRQLPGIVRIAAGNCSFHQNRNKNVPISGFSIDFENENAYDDFLNNPVTHPAKNCILNIAIDGYQGIFGFDLGKSLNVFPHPLDKYRVPTPRLMPRGSIR